MSKSNCPAQCRLLINGRFLSGPPTAVNNVARDLSQALFRQVAPNEIRLIVPPSLATAGEALGCEVLVHGTREGIAWEQLDLPQLRHQGVIAGFFNTVPLYGRGYVTMLHDAQVFDAPSSYSTATRLWRQTLSRRAAAVGNHILTVSDYSKRALLRHGLATPERIGIVPNGLGPVGILEPDSSVVSHFSLGHRGYCVALANLLPHKNIGLLLQAFASPLMQDLRLVLVGKANREAFLAAGHHVGDNVAFAGFISDAELAGLYASALAVLVPSFEEGFGLPALEAMAHGAAALVSDRGALPEVVGGAGIILPPQTTESWVRSILELKENPSRQARLAKAGRERAAIFTWDRAAQLLLGHLNHWKLT